MHFSGSSLNTFPSTLTGPLKYLHIGTFWWKTLNDWSLLQCYHFENGEEAFWFYVLQGTSEDSGWTDCTMTISYFRCTSFAVCSCRLQSFFKGSFQAALDHFSKHDIWRHVDLWHSRIFCFNIWGNNLLEAGICDLKKCHYTLRCRKLCCLCKKELVARNVASFSWPPLAPWYLTLYCKCIKFLLFYYQIALAVTLSFHLFPADYLDPS